MARIENKSIEVSPKNEQKVIDEYSRFGWTLVSTQELFDRDSHLERRGDDLYSVTETTNYVKLLFRRDKDMPYYNEIAELENLYYATLAKKPVFIKKGIGWILVLTLVTPWFLAAAASNVADILGWVVFIAIVGLGAFAIVKRVKYNSSHKEAYDREYPKWEQACTRILAETERYVY